MSDKHAVIYHGGCPDGFGAAVAFVEAYGPNNVRLLPARHGQPHPDVHEGEQVTVVDFCYPVNVLRQLARITGEPVHVYDHHKTALEFFDDFDGEIDELGDGARRFRSEKLNVLLDMNRSGAALTWANVCGGVPELIEYVEDRDLWRFNLPHSRAIAAYIRTIPHDAQVWLRAIQLPIDELVELGRGALAFLNATAANIVENQSSMGRFWVPNEIGPATRIFMPVAPAPYVVGSDVAEALMKHYGTTRAAYYTLRPGYGMDGDIYQYGLRGSGDHTVDDIAKRYGGGGHAYAAGFEARRQVHVNCDG